MVTSTNKSQYLSIYFWLEAHLAIVHEYLLLFRKIVKLISSSIHNEFFANDYHYRVEQIKKLSERIFASLANVGANTVLYGKGGTNKSRNTSNMCKVNSARLR